MSSAFLCNKMHLTKFSEHLTPLVLQVSKGGGDRLLVQYNASRNFRKCIFEERAEFQYFI